MRRGSEVVENAGPVPPASRPMTFSPVETVNPDAPPGLLIIADHASAALPPGYGSLGLDPGEFERHIAYDIGTAGVARGLAARLDATALLAGFSRLLIDPNRGEDDPTLVMKISDGAIVPGNRAVGAAETERRLDACYRPYDAAIRARITRAPRPAILSIHSFTPQLQGRPPRPWHAGVLWGSDEASARRMLDGLRADPALIVGANEPYLGGNPGETLDRHAFHRGLPNLLIEIRNDLIETEAGQAAWVDRLAPLVRAAFDGT